MWMSHVTHNQVTRRETQRYLCLSLCILCVSLTVFFVSLSLYSLCISLCVVFVSLSVYFCVAFVIPSSWFLPKIVLWIEGERERESSPLIPCCVTKNFLSILLPALMCMWMSGWVDACACAHLSVNVCVALKAVSESKCFGSPRKDFKRRGCWLNTVVSPSPLKKIWKETTLFLKKDLFS